MEENVLHQEQESSNSIYSVSTHASVKESSTKEDDQEIMQDIPSPNSPKKVNVSYENVEENKVILGSVFDLASGSFEGGAQLGVEDVGLQRTEMESKMGSFEEHACLEDTEREEEMMSFLEDKKKQLLERIETGSIFMAGVEGNDKSIRQTDNTALIESVSFTKSSNAETKKEKQEVGNKAKLLRRKGKEGRNLLETSEKQKKTTQFGKDLNKLSHLLESQNGSQKNSSLLRYSMEEMQSLRFVNIVEQRKLWKDIYAELGDSAMKEYDALTRDQKNIPSSLDPRRQRRRKEDVGASQREVSSENGKVELENIGEDGVENVCGLGPVSNASIEGEDVSTSLEAEYDEEEDSDEDYASIQKPVFHVEGEPDFDSGPPEDGWEYLRRVRWEAARIPKVVVAKLDRSKGDKEQSVYMPQIPEIAKCPEHLMPLKQWEDAFLADFSELRTFLSCDEDSSTEVSCNKQPLMATGHWQSTFPQLDESIIIQKFNDLRTDEVDNTIDQPSSSNAEDTTHTNYVSDFKCEYPTLSAILAMDPVTRVSMLKKRIALAETMSTLSKNDCMWLFALCAAVDTPLHADTCAALRSLLRKCASLRAAKSELDDEVIMLNILATISGRYFGQSES